MYNNRDNVRTGAHFAHNKKHSQCARARALTSGILAHLAAMARSRCRSSHLREARTFVSVTRSPQGLITLIPAPPLHGGRRLMTFGGDNDGHDISHSGTCTAFKVPPITHIFCTLLTHRCPK